MFAAFAFAADVGAVAEGHVGAVEADEFGDTEPGLHGQQHHCPVSSAFPSVGVGGGDQRGDLGGGQKRHDALVEPFRRDRQDTLDEQGVLGVAQRGEREQRTDRGQPHVPGPDAVVPVGLEMVEKRRDRGDVEVVPVQPGGRLPASPVHEDQQQLQRVAVGGDGARAGVALAGETVGEERLQCGGDQRHGVTNADDPWRAAAQASSSGTADRYQ